jgi:hypothetical protein
MKFIKQNKELIDFLEVIIPWERAEEKLSDVSALRESTGIAVYVANIESSIHREQKGAKFSHYICHGFHISDTRQVETILTRRGMINGFVFQIEQQENPLISVKKISEYAKEKGFKAIANVRLSSENPAEYLADDDYVAGKTVESVIASYAYPNVTVLLDTFIDHDRGYFPRIGLYDRRLNPRKSAHIARNLNLALQHYGVEISDIETQTKTGSIRFNTENILYQLSSNAKGFKLTRGSTVIDLVSGEINPKKQGEWYLKISKK